MKFHLSLLFSLLVCVSVYAAQAPQNSEPYAGYNERKQLSGSLPPFLVSSVLLQAEEGNGIGVIDAILAQERDNLTAADVDLSIKAITLQNAKQGLPDSMDSTPQELRSSAILGYAHCKLELFKQEKFGLKK